MARTDGKPRRRTRPASRAPGPGGALPGPARSLSPAGAGRSSRGRGVLTRDRPDGANTVRKHGRDPAAGTLQASPPSGGESGGGPPSPDARCTRRTTPGRDGRPRARGDGGRRRRTDRQLRGGGVECEFSRASAGRVRGGAEGAARTSLPSARGLRRFSSPGSGGPHPRPSRSARGRNRPDPERPPTLQARAPPLGGRTHPFRATVRRHDRPQSKTGKGAAAGSGAAGRLVATGVSRRPLCLRRGVGPVCRAGLFAPCGTLVVAYSQTPFAPEQGILDVSPSVPASRRARRWFKESRASHSGSALVSVSRRVSGLPAIQLGPPAPPA